MPTDWSPDSWKCKPATQQAKYPDEAALNAVVEQLGRLPPLVTSWEVESLKSQLALAAEGKMFLLQGGDCSESFEDCQSANIAAKLKILLQMSLVLIFGCRKPVIRVGRFAGQFAKPRSSDLETRDGIELPSYRGDLVNRSAFTSLDRVPNPELLLRGYERRPDAQLHSLPRCGWFRGPASPRELGCRVYAAFSAGGRVSRDYELDDQGHHLDGNARERAAR